MSNHLKNVCFPRVDPLDANIAAGYIWSQTKRGHAKMTRRPNHFLHRLIAARIANPSPRQRIGPITFIDGNPLNCTRRNLKFHVHCSR